MRLAGSPPSPEHRLNAKRSCTNAWTGLGSGPCPGLPRCGTTHPTRRPSYRWFRDGPWRHCRDSAAMLQSRCIKLPSPKVAPMLDVPKTNDKSHADGKILQSVTDGVGVIT